MAFTQVALQCLCFTVMLTMFYHYFPVQYKYGPLLNPTTEWASAVMAWRLALLGLAMIAAVSVYGLSFPQNTLFVANYLGLLAGLTALLQFMPQIKHTFMTRVSKLLKLRVIHSLYYRKRVH